VFSRGKESVTIKPRIEVYSEDMEFMTVLYLDERDLNKGQKVELVKTLDSSGFNAGNYIARSVVEYDGEKPAVQNITFRIGELSIDIVNHTKEITIENIMPFDIEIESGWNNVIEGAYAKVRISNDTTQIATFTTTPTSLEPWEKKTIVGHFNTSQATNGTYNVFMSVYYFGGGLEKTASEVGTVVFVYPEKKFEIDDYLVLSILLGIILFIVIFFKFRKKNAKRK
jgi:hypothetical protein